MTHRYSGRTAMLADVSVHEPKQATDEESALTYSMEGSNESAPESMRAYTWSPGWNSNQSINKFQDEIAGHLRHGDPGIRLFSGAEPVAQFSPGPGPGNDIHIVPRWHIFGSDELSNSSPAINSLAPVPYALMNPDTAHRLEVQQGNGLKLNDQEAPSLEVLIDESVPAGCVICPVLDTTRAYQQLTPAGGNALVKDESWTPRSSVSSASSADSIIMSDRGN
jgi:NADH-quinone oxidoreductase subunit G